jgi:hypothetical protein
MKRSHIILLAVLVFALAAPVMAESPYKPLINVSGIKLANMEGGKPTVTQRVVDLDIHEHEGVLDGAWREVLIMPSYDGENTILRGIHYSIKEGTMSDLSVRGNDASFDLQFDTHRKIRVLCQKTGPLTTDYEITATTAGHDQGKKDVKKIEWITVKSILLPSKNVW